MRIRIGTFWLAGDPTKSEREHSSALVTFAPQRLQQAEGGLRWENMVFIDRQNESWDITFDTSRLFASYAEVDAFCLSYMTKHPWSGTVSFRSDTGPATWVEYDLKNAVIVPPVILPAGVTLRLRYTVRGGKLQAGITSATVGGFDIVQEGGGEITQEGGGTLQQEH
jgi:hypothetical protein